MTPAEIGKNIEVAIPIVGDAKLVLKEIVAVVVPGDTTAWVEKLKKLKQQRLEARKLETGSGYVNPKKLLSELSKLTKEETVFATDVGQNQIWAANNLEIVAPRHFITSGGMGTMGLWPPVGSVGSENWAS